MGQSFPCWNPSLAVEQFDCCFLRCDPDYLEDAENGYREHRKYGRMWLEFYNAGYGQSFLGMTYHNSSRDLTNTKVVLGMDQPRMYRGIAGGNLWNAKNPNSQDRSLNMPISTHSSAFNLLNLFRIPLGAQANSNRTMCLNVRRCSMNRSFK